MGYAFYEIGGMKRGYGVRCKCHQRHCPKRIDRGLAYLCYRCTWYFCGEHLTSAEEKQECFAGESAQVCTDCSDEVDAELMDRSA